MKKFYIIMLFIYFVQHAFAQKANQNLSNLISPVAVNVDLLPGTDSSLNLGSSSKSWKDIYLDGALYLRGSRFLAYAVGTGAGNTAAGSSALNKNTSGGANTAIGFNALTSNTSGGNNTASGYRALYSNITSGENTANGASALYSNVSGSFNTGGGYSALYHNTTGSFNTCYGSSVMLRNISGNNNTAIGASALAYNTTGHSNVAIGTNALFKNTIRSNLVAIGDSALFNNAADSLIGGFFDASNNIAIGSKALFKNETGAFNTAVSTQVLYSNTSGNYNMGLGYQSLYSNTTGDENTAVGYTSLYSNTIGLANVAIGAYALYSNKTGKKNTALGWGTLYYNTSGSYNTAIGKEAMFYNNASYNIAVGEGALYDESGNYNTCLGYGTAAYQLTNATAVGSGAGADKSNQVIIGNGSVTSIGGTVGWTNFSDGRYKKNIKEDVSGLSFINLLKPVTYTLDIDAINAHFAAKRKNDSMYKATMLNLQNEVHKASEIVHNGFIAQEVEKAAHSINYNFSGVDKPETPDGIYGLRYSDFVVPLVKAVQELSKMNDSKDSIINNLETRLARIESLINTQQATVNGQQATVSISSASLEQNVPNPFTNTTTIAYTLPGKFSSAQIIITDKNGMQLKQLNLPASRQGLSGTGKGTIHIDAATLASGAYNYSLYVDGRLIATKQMIAAK